MKFNRSIWKEWGNRKPCPFCENGTLEFPKKDGYLKTETESSREINENSGYPYSDFIFSIHLKCRTCNEIVAVTGEMSEENYPSQESEAARKSIRPKIFYPPLRIIHIPESCPKEVSKILIESFSLFWLDHQSCANKIRISIEALLNHWNIPIQHTSKRKGKAISLHERLKIFEKQFPTEANLLIAIKWVGNAGSHHLDIDIDNVLNAYELLEFSLEKLYNDREKRLIELSAKINSAKKPI